MVTQIIFDASRASRSLKISLDDGKRRFAIAVRKTVDTAGEEIDRRAGVDILRAGKFTKRWTNAFTAEVEHRHMESGIRLFFKDISPKIPASAGAIHEFGGVVRGKPLLWIPLPWANLKEVWARDYPGGLFKVEREGKNPLLFSVKDREAKYVGVKQVTLRPRFHIRAIAANVVRTEFARMFFRFLNGGK